MNQHLLTYPFNYTVILCIRSCFRFTMSPTCLVNTRSVLNLVSTVFIVLVYKRIVVKYFLSDSSAICSCRRRKFIYVRIICPNKVCTNRKHVYCSCLLEASFRNIFTSKNLFKLIVCLQISLIEISFFYNAYSSAYKGTRKRSKLTHY